jgi:signal recognition particle subunit SRP68
MSVDGGEPMDDATPAELAAPVILSLPIFSIVSLAQRQHGLRHNDYQRYRQYCTRRLNRLRKSLHFMNGKQRFLKKEVTADKVVDARYLEIVLMDAERAWSYAMQLREATNPRQKFHLRGRIRKAVKQGSLLYSLCADGRCDARTELEATAYFEWIRGVAAFEFSEWKDSMLHLQQSEVLYEKLMKICDKDQQELLEQRLTDMRASVKFCIYNLSSTLEGKTALAEFKRTSMGGTMGALYSKLDLVMAEAEQRQAANVIEVAWLGTTVSVDNDLVSKAISSARAKEQDIAKLRSTPGSDANQLYTLYDELLAPLSEGLAAVSEELHILSAERNPTTKAEARMANLKFLQDYLKFLRGLHMRERCMHMIQVTRSNIDKGVRLSKADDVVRLCDNLIQICHELGDIDPVGEDQSLSKLYGSMAAYGKTVRCFYLAESFRHSSKFGEALALYDRCTEHAQVTLSKLREAKDVQILIEDVEAMLLRIRGQKISLHASHFLSETDKTDETVAGNGNVIKSLLQDRLGSYSSDATLAGIDPKLVAMPPDFEPIPCKPLFFDLAFDNLEFPSLAARVEQKPTTGAAAVSAVKGALGKLAGGLGGFWGGK